MQTKRKYILALALLLSLGSMAQGVIDEVIWVIGDEAILRSEVEEERLRAQYEGQQIKGDPYCVIPEQLAVQKLFLHQADDGKLLEMSVLNQDETVAFMVKCMYNKQGDLTLCEPVSEEDEYLSDRYVYEYDKKSNWRRRIHFKGDSAYSVTERVIEYY